MGWVSRKTPPVSNEEGGIQFGILDCECAFNNLYAFYGLNIAYQL